MKKGSESSSDRSKSSMGRDDETMREITGQNPSDNKSYSGLSGVPALSPPTPNVQSQPPPYAPGPSMARSASHNTALITPEESSNQPSTSLRPNISQSLSSQSEKQQEYLTGQSYDVRPGTGQLSYSGSSTGVAASQFSWQSEHYPTTSSGPSGGSEIQGTQPNLLGAEGGIRTTEAMGISNNPYVTLAAEAAPKPTRRSKDYFDGVAFFDKSVRSDVNPIMSTDMNIDSTMNSQQSETNRPVFTMPFGNPEGQTETPSNPMMDNIKGPWQRW